MIYGVLTRGLVWVSLSDIGNDSNNTGDRLSTLLFWNSHTVDIELHTPATKGYVQSVAIQVVDCQQR